MENTSRTSARVQVVVVVVVVSQSEGSAGRRGAQGSAETLTRRLPNAPNAGWSSAVLDRDESLYRLQLHKSCEDFFFFFYLFAKKKNSTNAPPPKITVDRTNREQALVSVLPLCLSGDDKDHSSYIRPPQ